jgi:cell division protein FtsZ
VLLSIAGGSDLGLFEINEAAALVAQAAHAEANIIFGAVIDDALGDEVRVTVIAAGFDGGMPKRRDPGAALRREPAPAPAQTQAETRAAVAAATGRGPGVGVSRPYAGSPAGSPVRSSGMSSAAPAGSRPAVGGLSAAAQRAAGSQTGRPQPDPADDDLDIPDFLK